MKEKNIKENIQNENKNEEFKDNKQRFELIKDYFSYEMMLEIEEKINKKN